MKEVNVDNLIDHPLTALVEIAKKHNVDKFKFRTYSGPEYGSGYRDICTYSVGAEELLTRGLDIIEEAEADGYDLAVESAVTVKGSDAKLHIPMIDFDVPVVGKEFAEDEGVQPQQIADAMRMEDGEPSEFRATVNDGSYEGHTGLAVNALRFFHSGRSLHAYDTSNLLTEEQWREYMAKLLISAPLDLGAEDAKLDLVDARWVGRRLLAGTGSLRLTCVDDNYVQVPTAVAIQPPTVRSPEPF